MPRCSNELCWEFCHFKFMRFAQRPMIGMASASDTDSSKKRPLLALGHWVPAGEAANWISLTETAVRPGSNIQAHFSRNSVPRKKGFLGSFHCLTVMSMFFRTECRLPSKTPKTFSSLLLEGLNTEDSLKNQFIHRSLVDLKQSLSPGGTYCPIETCANCRRPWRGQSTIRLLSF